MTAQGWRELHLREAVRFSAGSYLSARDYGGGPIVVEGAGGEMGRTGAPNISLPITVIGRVGTVGRPRYYPEGCWVNNNAAALVANDGFNPLFVFYAVSLLDFTRFTLATAQPYLSVEDLMGSTILAPDLDEQTAVAEALSVADEQIAALTAQRDKAKLVKLGMMQELLSGKRRLV